MNQPQISESSTEPSTASPKELTVLAIVLGLIIGVIMTAANVYLGLYAGMTVSASIPAAVLAMGVFRGLLNRNSILQSNIVQTMASAGESLAAGVIFTLPALVLVGAWQDFEFWPTTLIAMAGGLMGVVFMIPLRKALIVQDKDLTYPEGVACAAVLRAGADENSTEGLFVILRGLLVGAFFKFFVGTKLFVGSIEKAFLVGGKSIVFVGSDISPALLAVGYIVKLEVASLVFLGGALGWFVGIPIISATMPATDGSALDAAWDLWSGQVRYLGVGAMIVGGLWSIVSVRKGLVHGVKDLKDAYRKNGKQGSTEQVPRTDRNISLGAMFAGLMLSIGMMLGIYNYILDNWGMTLLSTMIMTVTSFFLVAVSSYIVGLVGSSNNPVSGMTISALLGSAGFFLALGLKGDSGIFATLGIAAVVCCAACTSGDCSQDLKTGHLVGATPRSQQIAQLIGVLIPAIVIAPVLSLLLGAYGIGDGEGALKAPQATLFASLTQALFGKGEIPTQMVFIGAGFGALTIALDHFFFKARGGFRLHLMPIAVGIYLPVTLAVPIFIGGLLRFFIEKGNLKKRKPVDADNDRGVLLGSGLIAGEAVMGVVWAIIISLNLDFVWGISGGLSEILALTAFGGLIVFLYTQSKNTNGVTHTG